MATMPQLKRFKLAENRASGTPAVYGWGLINSLVHTLKNKASRPFTQPELSTLHPATNGDVYLGGNSHAPQTWAEHNGRLTHMVIDADYELDATYEIGSATKIDQKTGMPYDTRRSSSKVEHLTLTATFLGFAPQFGALCLGRNVALVSEGCATKFVAAANA